MIPSPEVLREGPEALRQGAPLKPGHLVVHRYMPGIEGDCMVHWTIMSTIMSGVLLE